MTCVVEIKVDAGLVEELLGDTDGLLVGLPTHVLNIFTNEILGGQTALLRYKTHKRQAVVLARADADAL